MKSLLFFLLPLFLGGSLLAEEAELSFNRDVRPILSENCFFCHGFDSKNRKADLRLDTREGALAVLKPGYPEESELIYRLDAEDPDELMPPPSSHRILSTKDKEILRRWVKEGATFEKHWAYIPPKKEEVGDGHPIDVLVERQLKKEGLKLAPPAEPHLLARRLGLDLAGLPVGLASEAAAKAQAAFVAKPEPAAWERLVDALFATEAYGERMAWDWLDAARYADSNGYQGDRERTMWPWRDWVVRAFNSNLGYDKFTVMQLAGDLLPEKTTDDVLATGFCRNHAINGEGGRIAEENRIEYVFDMTETMGTIWMGLTLNCCRCHDHKYDQISHAEYFGLFDFFNHTPVTGGGGDPFTKPVLTMPSERVKELEAEKVKLAAEQKAMRTAAREQQAAWEKEQLKKEVPQSDWLRLAPLSATSKNGQTMTVQADGSVLTTGENPNKDVYVVEFDVSHLAGGKLTALQLEAMMDPSMTKGGLARSDSGNFVLTELSFELRLGESATPLDITSSKASFEQGGFKIEGTYDGKADTGWAVLQRPFKTGHSAVFHVEPVDLPEDAKGAFVRAELRFESRHRFHQMGRFRLFASQVDSPGLAAELSLADALRIPAKNRNQAERDVVEKAFWKNDKAYNALKKRRSDQEKTLVAARKSLPRVMVMEDMSKRRETFILNRGIYNKREDKVGPMVPAVLPELKPAGEHANRLDLANWLVADDNPLMARVTVNRLWQQVFGIGLVKTVEDFGVQSEIPRHMALLDWLAADFNEHWDVKRLLRLMVTSRVYQQSSKATAEAIEADPENRWLARGSRYRLPYWMIRDQALAASGLLVRTVGGKPVNGYQPPGIWEEASFGKKKYRQGAGDDLYRRSLYTFWRRIIAPPMFFDNASRNVCSVKSLRTNTPLQALFTLNDVTFVEAARVLAERTLTAEKDAENRLNRIYERVLGRKATKDEREILLAGQARSEATFKKTSGEAKQLLSIGESKADESLDPVVLASWTALCIAVLNLDETLTRE